MTYWTLKESPLGQEKHNIKAEKGRFLRGNAQRKHGKHGSQGEKTDQLDGAI